MQLRFSLNLLLFLTGINLSHEKQPYNRQQQQNVTQFPIEKKSQHYFVFIEMQLLFTWIVSIWQQSEHDIKLAFLKLK